MTAGRFPAADLHAVQNLLSPNSRVVITTHQRPDGDAMGSSLGLYNFLKDKIAALKVITPGSYPEFLHWLPGSQDTLNYEVDPKSADRLIDEADVIFCLDFNWLNRIDGMEGVVRRSKARKILVDHHLNPESVFDYNFSYTDASSTCELIYQLIAGLEQESHIDKNIATCLYCGILTDTDSFRFNSVKPVTHRIVARLLEAGAVNNEIYDHVFENYSEDKLRLTGYALLEKLVVLREYSASYITLSEDELKRFNFKSGDTEGLVNLALGISGIRLAAFFSQREGVIRISFRSKGDFSVKELAADHFDGGGHKNAAGGTSLESLDKAVKKFLSILPEYKTELSR